MRYSPDWPTVDDHGRGLPGFGRGRGILFARSRPRGEPRFCSSPSATQKLPDLPKTGLAEEIRFERVGDFDDLIIVPDQFFFHFSLITKDRQVANKLANLVILQGAIIG